MKTKGMHPNKENADVIKWLLDNHYDGAKRMEKGNVTCRCDTYLCEVLCQVDAGECYPASYVYCVECPEKGSSCHVSPDIRGCMKTLGQKTIRECMNEGVEKH